MGRFLKFVLAASAMASISVQVQAIEFFGRPGYNFDENTGYMEIQQVDINGDGKKELVGISSGEYWDSLTYYGGTVIWAFEWNKPTGTFKLLDSLFLQEEYVEGFQGNFAYGDVIPMLPGDEIVLSLKSHISTTQGFVKVIGWNSGFTVALTSPNLLQMEDGLLTPPVVANVDGDSVNEIVLAVNYPDTLNIEQTAENIDSMLDNPIVYPLVYCKVIVLDAGMPTYYNLANGIAYLASSANIDGDNYGDVVFSVSDINATNVNSFINDLIDFMEQFDSKKKYPMKVAALKTFGPLIRDLKKIIPAKAEKGTKGGTNFDDIITRTEGTLATPFPTIPTGLMNTAVYVFENGTATQKYSHNDGINVFQKAKDVDNDGFDEVYIRTAKLEIPVINNIVTDLNIKKVTEISISKWIDQYTGQVAHYDTLVYFEPANIPHNLSSLPITGKLVALDIHTTQNWDSNLEPFHPWASLRNNKIVTGENYTDVSKLNTLLTDLNGLWVDFRSHMPDSVDWFKPVIPSVSASMITGIIEAFNGVGASLFTKDVGGFLTSIAVNNAGVFFLELIPDYTGINNFISQFNSDYDLFYDDWVQWAADSITAYANAYDACLAVYNQWALAYYDSTQTGGNLPAEPSINWPDWPGNEPYFEEPEYTGNKVTMKAGFLDYGGNELWSHSVVDSVAFLAQHGFTGELDSDSDSDFVFLSYNPSVSDSGESAMRLYVYTTTPIAVEFPSVIIANSLLQNVPNPFNRNTMIRYSISRNTDVSIDVYTVGGRLVRNLVNEKKNPGVYKVAWDGKDDRGEALATGVYVYRIKAGDYKSAKKFVLIK